MKLLSAIISFIKLLCRIIPDEFTIINFAIIAIALSLIVASTTHSTSDTIAETRPLGILYTVALLLYRDLLKSCVPCDYSLPSADIQLPSGT